MELRCTIIGKKNIIQNIILDDRYEGNTIKRKINSIISSLVEELEATCEKNISIIGKKISYKMENDKAMYVYEPIAYMMNFKEFEKIIIYESEGDMNFAKIIDTITKEDLE